ncbi:MAG: hypothetical protein ACPLZY_02850 [Candidatus Norongarragalinales archaeon]
MFTCRIYRRGKTLWQEIVVEPGTFKAKLGGMPCQHLCGHGFRRFHLTCAFCRVRRVYMGKMPSRIRVTPYLMLIWVDRPHRRLKDLFLKKLLTLAEFLAN